MHTNLLWKAKEYPSLENCVVTITDAGSEISSVVIGTSENKMFRVEYTIKTNRYWETEHFEIKSQIAGSSESFSFYSDGKGNWQANGQPLTLYQGCIDIDLPLTPFTNTLPIKRLDLKIAQQQLIKVIYLDLLNQEIKPVTQKYTRLSEHEYKYENVPNDFEAVIRIDELGLVVDYPSLFERIARIDKTGL